MKKLLIIFVFFAAISASGQTQKEVKTLTLAFNDFKVPEGCKAESQYQVKCSDFSMVWLYLNTELLKTLPEQAINKSAKQLKDFTKTAIPVYVLGDEIKGYRISFKNGEDKTLYQIVAYGVVKNQPVIVQLTLDKEPKTDADLPDFPKQILKLSK